MLLQKMPILLMRLAKWLLITPSILTLHITATASILYKTEDEAIHAYYTCTLSEVETGANNGDARSLYLLAQHQIADNADKSVSIHTLLGLANHGISDAKYSLYLISKQSVTNNLSKQDGLQYLFEAAEDSYTPAQKELAILYLYGNGIEHNDNKYHYWQDRAAQQGDSEAMISLARSYFAGKGTTRDNTKGFQWVLKALETEKSRFNDWDMLAQLYEQGRGTPVDLVKAYMCYDLEGTAGIDEKARIAPRMTEAERAEGLRLSREWQEQNHSYTFPALGLEHQPDGSYRHR